MHTILLILIVFLNLSSFEKQNCGCKNAHKNETTRFGGNEKVTIVEEKTFQKIQGKISNLDPNHAVLVELFINPEHFTWDYPDNVKKRSKQKRIAACLSDEQGNFCFKNIRSGKYEIRCSIGSEWNVTYVYVVVDTKKHSGSAENLSIQMKVGT